MSAAWNVLVFVTVVTVALDVLQLGNVASIYDRVATYDTNVVVPGDPPVAPLSRLEFWGQFIPLLLLNLTLMSVAARLVFSASHGWKYLHYILSALLLISGALFAIWLLIAVVPNCNKTALNICTDQRYCCAKQTIAPSVDPEPGCPILLQGCDPDQTAATLGWNPGFSWLIALLWIDVLFGIAHLAISWWLGSSVSEWVVGGEHKAYYNQVTESKVESGLMSNQVTSYKNFVPVATVGAGMNKGAKMI